MTRTLLSVALVVLGACKHDHGPGETDEHGHGHGSTTDSRAGAAPAAPERPTLAVTKYQSGLELFMEYAAFAVGQDSPLIAHFTDARDPSGFHPVTLGSVRAVLRYEDGSEATFVAETPLRDGIFKPVVKPARAGKATLTLTLISSQVAGTVEAGEVVVHPNLAAAVAAVPADDTGEKPFPFLKEQQWKTEYATAPAEPRVLQGGVRANGELKAVGGQSVDLAAPVAARVAVGDPVPYLGQPVTKNQLLVRVLPTSTANGNDVAMVELEVSRARGEVGLAERELERMQVMLAERAIPEKQVDAARVAHELARARLAAAERQSALFRSTQVGGRAVNGTAFELRSPLVGIVAFADVSPGAILEPGTRLVTVVNTDKLWLEARVYAADAPQVEHATGASFSVPGFAQEFTVDSSNGRLVAVGAMVERATRTVPVLFELSNPEGKLKPGMFAKVTLFTGETTRALAIPESAVIDDNGKPAVFVMDGGEAFFKRTVRLGIRAHGFVQLLDGVREGERVVSRGAYELKLATASGSIPEHGHQH
jgi:RND family efflux transporter MFP subunit